MTWGRDHCDLTGITAIGIDEIQWQRGHKYLTLVYQLDVGRKRLLWLGGDRKVKTLLRFFRWLGKDRAAALRFICSDMWKPYLRVVAKKAGHALHILDRFHIMSHMSKAIDEVRAKEARDLKAQGYAPVLKHTRWLLLKRPEHLTEQQEPASPNCSATTCGRSAATSCGKTFSSSGPTCPPPGPGGSWIAGARAPCGPRSSP